MVIISIKMQFYFLEEANFGLLLYFSSNLLLAIILLILSLFKQPTKSNFIKPSYSEETVRAFKRYYLLFRFPGYSKFISDIFVCNSICSIVLLVWLLVKGKYELATVTSFLVLFSLISTYRLKPYIFQNREKRNLLESIKANYQISEGENIRLLKKGAITLMSIIMLFSGVLLLSTMAIWKRVDIDSYHRLITPKQYYTEKIEFRLSIAQSDYESTLERIKLFEIAKNYVQPISHYDSLANIYFEIAASYDSISNQYRTDRIIEINENTSAIRISEEFVGTKILDELEANNKKSQESVIRKYYRKIKISKGDTELTVYGLPEEEKLMNPEGEIERLSILKENYKTQIHKIIEIQNNFEKLTYRELKLRLDKYDSKYKLVDYRYLD